MADPSTRSPTLPAQAAKVFAACGGGLLVLLLVRNRDLFTRAIYEAGDPASNSMLTIQAKHFALFTGHYSRVGFHHPGPAFFYVQAAGEWLLHDVTHIVPAAYNGQMIAIMALNATLLGLALMILYTWVGSSAAVFTGGRCHADLSCRAQTARVFHLDSVRMLRAVPALPLRACLGVGRPAAAPVDHGARRRPAGARARGVSRPGARCWLWWP